MSAPFLPRSTALLAVFIGLFMLVAGACTSNDGASEEANAAPQPAAESPPAEPSASESASASASYAATARADTTQVAEGCYYDSEKSPVENPSSLVDFQDPSQGNADAPVTIVEYFDPNCPHCKTMHEVMKQAVEQYGDEAQFVYKPMPLWGFSVPQIEALYAAAQEGKFIPMLEAQYARQQQGGLSMDQLRAIAREIDMNPDVLASRVEQNTYRSQIMQQRQRAIEIGVDSTPTILVNGRFVDGRSRTLRCIGEFIDAARENATTTSSG
jgi:protein-disulfide isomerase